MENKDKSAENTEILKDWNNTIDNAEVRIEDEFNRTANSWPACFVSTLFALETYLSPISRRNLIAEEKIAEMERRLEELKTNVAVLNNEYPEKETPPSDEIKKELLEKLNLLKIDF